MSYRGGYLETDLALVAGRDDTFAATPSPGVIDALNAVQGVAWSLNAPIIKTMSGALERGDLLGDLPRADPYPLPEPADWDSLSADEHAEIMAERAAVHELNKERSAKFIRLHRCLNIAKRMEQYSPIYFPHQIDGRGRYLPAPADLHPQSHAWAKAMLRFAEPRPLTSEGGYWLAIGLANAAGKDKLALDERAAWVRQHHDLILDSANDPEDGERLWCHADEPWTFLALAKDYAAGVTRTPVCIDATCSGLQHLAALARDLEVAQQVNLVDGPRADLYQTVAQVVARAVTSRALAGDSGAMPWVNNVGRDTVKRPCMTLSYGATTSGRREQLMPFAMKVAPRAPLMAARWLCSVLEEVLHAQLVGPMQTLRYFTQIAKTIARANRAVSWTTPSGLKVRQQYNLSDEVRVNTLAGRLTYRRPRPQKANLMQTGNATAPNVVHSLDAAHLTAMVLRWGDGEPLQVIHDSVGTYANDVGRLAEIARSTFAEMYAKPILHDWHQQQVQQHPDLATQFVDPPELGAWAPEMVRTSTYFFS